MNRYKFDQHNYSTGYRTPNFHPITDLLDVEYAPEAGFDDLIAHMALNNVNVLSITPYSYTRHTSHHANPDNNEEIHLLYSVTIEFQYTPVAKDPNKQIYMKPVWRRFSYVWRHPHADIESVVAYGYLLATRAREKLTNLGVNYEQQELEV